MRKFIYHAALALLGLAYLTSVRAELVLFDAHAHYNADVWPMLSPQQAIARLDRAGIARAVVSSTPTQGTERLHGAAPDRVTPLLRPYRSEADRGTWFKDPETLKRLRQQLARFPYRGIGEFHLFSEQADTPVIKGLLEIARQHELILLAHCDTQAIESLAIQAPDLDIVWAHAGFDVPLATLSAMLERHPRLYLELSFREGIVDSGGLSPAWRDLFVRHSDRFMIGLDTYTPGRWRSLDELAAQARSWLQALPPEIGRAIAFDNAAGLFLRP